MGPLASTLVSYMTVTPIFDPVILHSNFYWFPITLRPTPNSYHGLWGSYRIWPLLSSPYSQLGTQHSIPAICCTHWASFHPGDLASSYIFGWLAPVFHLGLLTPSSHEVTLYPLILPFFFLIALNRWYHVMYLFVYILCLFHYNKRSVRAGSFHPPVIFSAPTIIPGTEKMLNEFVALKCLIPKLRKENF